MHANIVIVSLQYHFSEEHHLVFTNFKIILIPTNIPLWYGNLIVEMDLYFLLYFAQPKFDFKIKSVIYTIVWHPQIYYFDFSNACDAIPYTCQLAYMAPIVMSFTNLALLLTNSLTQVLTHKCISWNWK
jgi:hypothetical protein